MKAIADSLNLLALTLICVGLYSLVVPSATAQQNFDKVVRLTAEVHESPPKIQLNWLPPGSGSTPVLFQKLHRRVKGSVGWGNEYALLGSGDFQFIDTEVELGIPYEYRLIRIHSGTPWVATGYLQSGIRHTADDLRGKLLLVIEDDLLGASLIDQVDRFRKDLVGDGWEVITIPVDKNDSVPSVKAAIVAEFAPGTPPPSDFVRPTALLLFGDIPVPYSGDLFPDGHTDHRGAWPADVYYGEFDEDWTDTEIDNVQATGTRNDNVPGDGKWDPSILPSRVDLQIGRVDLANMPLFGTELELLERYLDRNHQYRHLLGSYASVPRQGILAGNFINYRGEDTFASNAWWNFTSFFGASNISTASGSNWFEFVSNSDYLWGLGAGAGTYTSAARVATSSEMANNDSRVVFNLFLGSYFGDWDNTNNFLRSPLAATENSLGLASIWSGRPHYHLHHMAMGETLGFGVKLSQNNVIDYSSGFFAAHVHAALMGDPSLRLFPVASPTNLEATTPNPREVELSWTASPDATNPEKTFAGYYIYRGTTPEGPFQRLSGNLISGTTFTDTAALPNETYHYMVRAVVLEESASGTYFNPSQGIFAEATVTDTTGAPEIHLSSNDQVIFSGDIKALEANGTDFGATTTALTKTFTIKNAGNISLNLNGTPPVSLVESHPSSFIVSQPAGTSIPPGGEETFSITFTPVDKSLHTATLSIPNNDPSADEAPYQFTIEGRGEVDITVSPAALEAGNNVSIANSGLGASSVEVINQYGVRRSSDSDCPAVYDWIEIEGIGTRIEDWTGSSDPLDNGYTANPISLGFSFPFYGNTFGSVIVSTEGFLSFTDSVDAPSNGSLPNFSAPSNIIALFWDDLKLYDGSSVTYLQLDPETFVIQYSDVGPYKQDVDTLADDESVTFQAILKANGEILIQYKYVSANDSNSYTAGIQNADRSLGKTAIPYIDDNEDVQFASNAFAVRFVPADQWLEVTPISSSVAGGDTDVLSSSVLNNLTYGKYIGEVIINHEDPEKPSDTVEYSFTGGLLTPEIALSGYAHAIPYGATTVSEDNGTFFGLLPPDAPSITRSYSIENNGSDDLRVTNIAVTGPNFSVEPLTSPLVIPPESAATILVTYSPMAAPANESGIVQITSNDPNEATFDFAVQAIHLTPIQNWRLAEFGDYENSGLRENTADKDKDGVINLLEYAFALDPNQVDSEFLPCGTFNANGRYEISFTRTEKHDDLTYTVEASSDLENWIPIAESVMGAQTQNLGAAAITEVTSGNLTTVTVEDGSTALRKYLRIKVEVP